MLLCTNSHTFYHECIEKHIFSWCYIYLQIFLLLWVFFHINEHEEQAWSWELSWKWENKNIRTSWKLSLHAQCSQKTSQLIRHTSKTLIFRNDLNYKQEQVNFACFFLQFHCKYSSFLRKNYMKECVFQNELEKVMRLS